MNTLAPCSAELNAARMKPNSSRPQPCTLAAGAAADVCVIDPSLEWQVDADALRSQGKHTPFIGYAMQGRARFTLVGGRVVHEAVGAD